MHHSSKLILFWLAGDQDARVQQRATGKIARELHLPATATSKVFCSELSEDQRDWQVFNSEEKRQSLMHECLNRKKRVVPQHDNVYRKVHAQNS